jgi:hypothetical protein
MSEPRTSDGPAPSVEDWDEAPVPKPVWLVVLLGALATLGVAGAVLAVTAALSDDSPGRPSAGEARSVDEYNPTGYDGDGAEVVLDRISVGSGGNTVVLVFDGPRARPSQADVADRPASGSCSPMAARPEEGSYLNLELEGAVNLSALDELIEETGVIITGRRPVGAVRSVTITCHGPEETVLAVGLADEHLYSVDDPPGSDRIVIQLSA